MEEPRHWGRRSPIIPCARVDHRNSLGRSNGGWTYVCDSFVDKALLQKREIVGCESRHTFGPRVLFRTPRHRAVYLTGRRGGGEGTEGIAMGEEREGRVEGGSAILGIIRRTARVRYSIFDRTSVGGYLSFRGVRQAVSPLLQADLAVRDP